MEKSILQKYDHGAKPERTQKNDGSFQTHCPNCILATPQTMNLERNAHQIQNTFLHKTM